MFISTADVRYLPQHLSLLVFTMIDFDTQIDSDPNCTGTFEI